jgi:hypothetical protein
MTKKIRELYRGHDGKVSDKWDFYLDQYDEKFAKFHNLPIRLLEIGIQNGGSLEIWDKYFEQAEILVGCDINSKAANLRFDSKKIQVVVGDANLTETQNKIQSIGNSYDIIIDDGSHTSQDIVRSFVNYFPQLKNGGLYVIEDLHCSYWQSYTGGLNHPLSSISFFKKLTDIANYEHWGIEKKREDILRIFELNYGIQCSGAELQNIYSIEFANSMCFIRKEEPSKNLIGSEWIVGENSLVEESVSPLSSNPKIIKVPSQKTNSWSNNLLSPEEEVIKLRRQQQNLKFDPVGAITVVINNRNLLTWPKKMVEHISKYSSLAEIIVVDNGSTYEPLLDWYSVSPHKIIRRENIGHYAPWIPEINTQIKTDFYVVTDPDLDISLTPLDTLEHLAMLLIRFKELGKIGLSLDITSVPKESPYYDHVNSHEKRFWDLPVTSGLVRLAPVDTTFAIYNKRLLNSYKITGGRSVAPYFARHMPWEIIEPSAEFQFYINTANQSSSYNSFMAKK